MELLDLNMYVGIPHTIKIINNVIYNQDKRKMVVNGKNDIIATLQSNGKLSAKIKTSFIGNTKEGIPIFEKKVIGCDPLPKGYDLYIVSSVYAKAYTKIYGYNEKLYTVADSVYSIDGRTLLGQRGICKCN